MAFNDPRNSDPGYINFILKSDEQVQEFINSNDKITQDINLLQRSNSETGSRKSLTERLFSRIEAGSLRGSIFAMSSLALGTGCLALPLQLKNMSIFMALFMLFFSALSAYWSLSIMILSSVKYKSQDYSNLVFKVFGKCFSKFLDITIIVYIFGILISYQVLSKKLLKLVYDFIGSFIFYCFINENTYDNWKYTTWHKAYLIYPIMLGIAFIILIPLCLLKDISKMRFASLAGIIIILYSIIVVVIQFPFFFHHYLNEENREPINYIDIEKGFTSELLFFQGAGVFFFSFTCHVGAFPVYKTLKNNGLKRIQKVFRRSIILDTVVYLLIGLCGYLSVPDNTPEIIINRISIFKNDIFMIIGRLGISITLMLTLPANYNALRLSFMEQVFGNSELDNRKNLLITIPTILSATFVAILYDKITAYINILGGFCSVIIAFIFPGIIFI